MYESGMTLNCLEIILKCHVKATVHKEWAYHRIYSLALCFNKLTKCLSLTVEKHFISQTKGNLALMVLVFHH